MFYDTTYKLGDLFVSVLSFQHILFEKGPVIQVAFMMHDKRDAKFHERFFDILKDHVPNFSKTSFPIICDREPGIKSAISNILPNIPIVHCWNHIKNDVKVWLTKHKATQDDLSVFMRDVRNILECESEMFCVEKIHVLEQKWSEEFRIYFHRHIKRAIIEHSGRWILEKLKIYDMYSGITTNAAESLNNVIKSVQKRKQLPVDMINLTLFFLQKYIYTEIQCGRAGFGNYILKEEFSYAKIDPAEIQLSSFKGNPDSILQQAKDQLDIFASSNCKTNEHLTTFPDNYCQNGNTDIHLIDKSDGLSDCFKDKNITTIDDKEEYERKGIDFFLSQKMLAEQVIHKDLIKYVSSMNY